MAEPIMPAPPEEVLATEDRTRTRAAVSSWLAAILTLAGAVISGKVTFSDGEKADWYLDQTGRLGLGPQKQGYRPPASDVQRGRNRGHASLVPPDKINVR